jgi:alpha-D-ribose 1-methylphosphonate 5-triphosphate synthase subunit PhnG
VKNVIAHSTASTLPQLIEELQQMAAYKWFREPGIGTDPSSIYVTINSDSIRMKLVEETLTDGSKVFNVELSEVCKEAE